MPKKTPPQEIRLVLRGSRYLARDLGRLVQQVREQIGVTQGELAHRADVQRQNVNRVENGRREGKLSNLNRLARALGYQVELVLTPIPPKPGAETPDASGD